MSETRSSTPTNQSNYQPKTHHTNTIDQNTQVGKASEWYHFIKELDRQRARGVQVG
jgi:hypothetical protein